ncbi:MAG: 50S ribosomal protein L18 [Candidatus Daviesbacteria bacterium]|nr:50S ribosomal protein L18 [Candidatus Daviesbacteria bacterium]
MKNLRTKRHFKIRRKVVGSQIRPRLAVFRSSQHIYAQLIDDASASTIIAESDIKLKGTKKEKAYETGKKLAEKALKVKITEVVFDRGGFLYHGRVQEVARGAREGGLKF